MSDKNTVTIKQALNTMISDLKLKGKLDESRIRELWSKLMGNPIAKYTKGVSLNKSKLYVQVDSPALKQELQYSREKIKVVFNKELGEEVIKEVVVF